MNDTCSQESMNRSRRSFLAAVTRTAAAVGASPLLVTGAAQAQDRARDAAFDISVFSKCLQWLDYPGTAGIAAEAGFDGVDLTVRAGGHVLPERVEEDLPKAVEAATKAGIHVRMIVTDITDPREARTAAGPPDGRPARRPSLSSRHLSLPGFRPHPGATR